MLILIISTNVNFNSLNYASYITDRSVAVTAVPVSDSLSTFSQRFPTNQIFGHT